jgi:hypothetical protein
MVELEKLKKQKISHLQLEPLLEDLKRLMEFWFNNPSSDYNIGKNFEELQKKHEQYFSKIDEFFQSKINLPDTLAGIETELKNLYRPQDDLAKSLSNVALADQIFSYSLDTLINGLQNNKASLERIINDLDYPELKPQFDKILQLIQSWINKAVYTKVFVLEASRKRTLVFGIANGRLVFALERKYTEISGLQLKDIRAKIDSILYARDLLIDIENWWFNAAKLNGFGGGYLTKYLQFEKPLLIMRADYAQGASFRKRVAFIKDNLPAQTKAEFEAIETTLEERLATLKVQIDKLLEGGWQVLLDRQKFLVKAREANSSNLSIECKRTIDEFNNKADNVTTLIDFRIAEESYRKHIDTCSG